MFGKKTIDIDEELNLAEMRGAKKVLAVRICRTADLLLCSVAHKENFEIKHMESLEYLIKRYRDRYLTEDKK